MEKNTNFFNSNSNKRAIVGLTLFSLILILAILLFTSSYFFYNISKQNTSVKIKDQEILNSLLTFRSDLLNLVAKNNSKLIYSNPYDLSSIMIYVNNTSIKGNYYSSTQNVEVNISSLGVHFCSAYNFSPMINSTFSFNGSCISKN